MKTSDQLFTWSLNGSLRDRIQSIIARPKPSLLLRTTLVLGIIGLAIVGLAKAAEARKFVAPAEFKEHFERVGMAETMHHTEFRGVTNGVAGLRVQSMNPLTRKWSEQLIEIEVEKLDPAFRAEILKIKTTPGASGEVKANPGKVSPALFPGRGEWGPEAEGLSCRVKTDKTEYEIVDEVRLLVEVRNTSDTPLSLGIGPLSTIHAGDNKPFSTKQSGTLGITFAQAKEGKQGFFSTSPALFPKGTEFETQTVVVQPQTTYSEVLARTPWGPTYSSIPSTAQPGKMNVSGGLMQLLKPDGKITHLEFKPVEIAVKAKDEGANDDASYRAITQNILTKVVALKGQFPILEKLQVPEVAANGQATLEFEHGVTWVLDDPTQKASKTNGRRAVFEKDGLHFRLHFYRGRWEGAAMFIPVNFGDLNLWFTYEYRQGDDPGIIVAISKIIQEEKRISTRVKVREVRKKDDKVDISVIDDTLFVDVTSPSGIGSARLALTSGEWMKKVVVRLKYAADKPFSMLEGPEATLEELEARHDQAAIHLNVRRFEKKDGFEADLPIGVHQKGSKVLNVSWIDAYRN